MAPRRSSPTTCTSTPRRRTSPSRRCRCSASASRLGFYGAGQADVLLADGQLDRLPEQRRHEVPGRPGARRRSPCSPTRTRATPTPRTPSPTRCRRVGGTARLRELRASTTPTRPRCWPSPRRAKDAGAQAVYTNFYGTAPAQLQANLNQIDAERRRAQRLARATRRRSRSSSGRPIEGLTVRGLHGHVAEPDDPGGEARTWTP